MTRELHATERLVESREAEREAGLQWLAGRPRAELVEQLFGAATQRCSGGQERVEARERTVGGDLLEHASADRPQHALANGTLVAIGDRSRQGPLATSERLGERGVDQRLVLVARYGPQFDRQLEHALHSP